MYVMTLSEAKQGTDALSLQRMCVMNLVNANQGYDAISWQTMCVMTLEAACLRSAFAAALHWRFESWHLTARPEMRHWLTNVFLPERAGESER